MKHAFAFAIIIAAFAVQATGDMYTNLETGSVSAWPPPHPSHVFNPGIEWYAAQNWVPFTTEQQSAWDSAEASAQAEADAQRDAWENMPSQFPNGIAVQDDQGHWMKLVSVTNQAPPVMLQVSESPLEPSKYNSMVASNSAAWRKKFEDAKAGIKGQLQDRVSRQESLMGVAP